MYYNIIMEAHFTQHITLIFSTNFCLKLLTVSSILAKVKFVWAKPKKKFSR